MRNPGNFFLNNLIILFCALVLTVSCVTKQQVKLSDVNSKFANLENSNLDPLRGIRSEKIITNKPEYDGLIEQANKSIITLKLGENVAESAINKLQNSQDLKQEMAAAIYLEEELPAIIAGIPILENKTKDLKSRMNTDFSGASRSSLPAVSAELNRIEKELEIYSDKAPKIFAEITRLRTDGNNYASKTTVEESKEEATKDSTEAEGLIEEEPPEEKTERIVQNNSESESNQNKIAGPEIRKLPGTYGPTGKVTNPEEEISEQERLERKYNQQLKDGLIQVFRGEANRNVKSLAKLTLYHPIPRVRAAAALALGRIKQGRWSLQNAIDKDGYVVRTAAFKALAEIGHKSSLSYFIAGSKSNDPEIQAPSFHGLGKTKDPVGRELILSRGLTSDKIIVIAESLRGLGYFRVPADLELIRKYLAVDDKELKTASIESLVIHNTPDSLKVLEESLNDYPQLTLEILEAIGQSSELAATFFLVRASQLYEDEKILERVGQLLLKRKAFGLYGLVMVQEDFLRTQPNERATVKNMVRLTDVGIVHKATPKRYVVRVGESLLEDVYRDVTFENRIAGTKARYSRGWIFGKKMQLISISKPGSNKPAKLENLETGKHQNLFDPGTNKTSTNPKPESE
ncbi:HEAT repeat domain-containing protein [Leptospira sp. GIMC2001]|uniref:HEAT repeat domain-containing protein n=1 Tax=Leptospira sp. GIMC2001 TaxID=1513297 RepID=UPI00234AA31F|nr:HEAT repeat domain-containing protein [Leptospira sp. GIMC2001]WCL49804.1 HEAT repeat domain-containing protein [Leptospira sp. GIMC2001]